MFKLRFSTALARLAVSAALVLAPVASVCAETLEGALAKAYINNPDLNAERAGVRVSDENLPISRAGQRPRVQLTLDQGWQRDDSTGLFGRRGVDWRHRKPEPV
jgi:outer membrane protein